MQPGAASRRGVGRVKDTIPAGGTSRFTQDPFHWSASRTAGYAPARSPAPARSRPATPSGSLIETMISSASSGSSFQTDGRPPARRGRQCRPSSSTHVVVELELELPRDDEVELFLRLVPVPVGALAARVLRHAAVGQRHLLGVDLVRDQEAHLAGVVALEDVRDLVERADGVAGHGLPPAWRIETERAYRGSSST